LANTLKSGPALNRVSVRHCTRQ